MSVAGDQHNLTCMATIVGLENTPTFTWTGPPNGGPLPSDSNDTRMVSDVMSSGSTHTSILTFDPLKMVHSGRYACTVTVGTVSNSSTFDVTVAREFLRQFMLITAVFCSL